MENQENLNNKEMGGKKTPEEIDEHSHVTNEDLEGSIINRRRVTIVINQCLL